MPGCVCVPECVVGVCAQVCGHEDMFLCVYVPIVGGI